MTLNSVTAKRAAMNMPGKNKYLQILEEAWQAHLAPRASDALTVISTFAGCGGSSLGYSMAGFRELLAVEWDDNAVETFRLNFPHVPVYHGDIAKLSVEECMKLAGLTQPGELDVFDGSPPCQGFSTAGKREFSDDRNQFFRQYVRLLQGLQPKVFVMENVSGMVKGKMKLIFAEIMRELKATGYQVSARLLNAMYFNVPQSRERMIFIGVRNDIGIQPSHPRAQSNPFTVKQAWFGLEDITDRILPDILKKYAEIHPDNSWNTDFERFKKIKGNSAGSISLKWAQWNRPLGTIGKSEIALTGIVHPNKYRYLNLAEVKRCGSFYDDFKFTDRRKGWERIGNSVPPLFMRAIACHIQEAILNKKAV